MSFTAISDRILLIPDPNLALYEKPVYTGVIHSIGPACEREGKLVKEGDRIAFAKGNHPVQGDFTVIREEQIYAKLL